MKNGIGLTIVSISYDSFTSLFLCYRSLGSSCRFLTILLVLLLLLFVFFFFSWLLVLYCY